MKAKTGVGRWVTRRSLTVRKGLEKSSQRKYSYLSPAEPQLQLGNFFSLLPCTPWLSQSFLHIGPSGLKTDMSSDEKQPLLAYEAINDDVQQAPVYEPLFRSQNKAAVYINQAYFKFREGFSMKMFLMLLGLIFVGTANRVAFKIMTNATALRVHRDPDTHKISADPKYSTFIAQVTNFIYMPVFWPIVWYFMLKTKRYVFLSHLHNDHSIDTFERSDVMLGIVKVNTPPPNFI